MIGHWPFIIILLLFSLATAAMDQMPPLYVENPGINYYARVYVMTLTMPAISTW